MGINFKTYSVQGNHFKQSANITHIINIIFMNGATNELQGRSLDSVVIFYVRFDGKKKKKKEKKKVFMSVLWGLLGTCNR